MEYRILGRTGLKVSVFGIGGWQLSGALVLDGKPDGFPDIGRDRAIAIVKGCRDLGINLIDTAEIYGDGEGERRIGAAIEGERDRWIVSSKFGIRRGTKGERITNSHPDTIRNSLEGSLRRLNTDYLDIYLYHAPPQPESIAEGKEVLETLKQEGKIRFYGISTDNPQELQSLVDIDGEGCSRLESISNHRVDAVDVVSCPQSLINYPQKILNLVRANNLGMMTRGALAAGQLSGKYFHQSPQLSTDDFRYSFKFDWNKYQFLEKFVPEGASMSSFAMRYLLDLDTTQTILVGGKSLADYTEAISALDLNPLDKELHSKLERARYWQNTLRRAKSAVKKLLVKN